MWNERYALDGYAYGDQPNDFIAQAFGHLSSPVLCLASGEGRNAVWLAQQGLEVHAVDGSHVGVDKTLATAAARGVTVHAQVGDLATFDLGTDRWGGITSVFAHMPPPIRARLHDAIPRALKPGGVLLMEMYTPRQLGRGTGGPPMLEMLYDPEDLRTELAPLHFDRLEEVEREVVEGRYHTGMSAVVQVIARR